MKIVALLGEVFGIAGVLIGAYQDNVIGLIVSCTLVLYAHIWLQYQLTNERDN